ncbi:hypothetical protein ACX6XY_07265 [Streptomyces sp. O3]
MTDESTRKSQRDWTWGILGVLLGVPILFFLALALLFPPPDRDIDCDLACDGRVVAAGTTVTYDDGLQVTVSPARWFKEDVKAQMTVTLRNTGSEPVAQGTLSMGAFDTFKSMSLEQDWQDSEVVGVILPGDVTEVRYSLWVENLGSKSLLKITATPGDTYKRARWTVRMPVE